MCKNYLDTLNDIIDDLGLSHMFAHADEDVYSKLVQIIWKHGNHYKNIVMLMGGFHLGVYRIRVFRIRPEPDFPAEIDKIRPDNPAGFFYLDVNSREPLNDRVVSLLIHSSR